MDITQLNAEVAKDETGVTIEISKKDGTPYLAADGTPCTITVLGSESKRYRDARDLTQRRALHKRRVKLEPADIMRNRIELAAAAITDWHGWEIGGKEAACTPEHIQTLLKVYHILEQVEEGIESHADFFAAQSTNSSK